MEVMKSRATGGNSGNLGDVDDGRMFIMARDLLLSRVGWEVMVS